MLTDFHMHTLLSDGVLLPAEHIRRAVDRGFEAIAITDHVDSTNIDFVITHLNKIRDEFAEDIIFLPGVEITHVPPAIIPAIAKQAKDAGFLVVVHGETIVEPVKRGTNLAALSCLEVDILAHPGLLSVEEATLAVENDIFLELSFRGGHCLTNGHVARLAQQCGAKMLVNSDFHTPANYLTEDIVEKIIRGSGLTTKKYFSAITKDHPTELLQRFDLM